MDFDFKKHKIDAVDDYIKIRPTYERFAASLKEILTKALKEKRTNYHSIEARAKEIDSFGNKVVKGSNNDPSKPKYQNPLDEITDLSGVRIITFFPKTVDEIGEIINSQFEIVEKIDKSEILKKEEKLGYLSVHYLIRLKTNRTTLPEYQTFKNLMAEIQVRTILQHAWAEIEHDIKYKSSITMPKSIRRRFISLAGLLEIADREFQSIQDDDKKLKSSDRKSVKQGNLEEVIITPDSLKAYLDKTLGPDGRISSYSYDWETEILLKMGFKHLAEIDDCISGFVNNPKVELSVWGSRQGQIWRFEDYLLAGLGEDFINRHPRLQNESWWENTYKKGLVKMKKEGIKTGRYKIKNNTLHNIK